MYALEVAAPALFFSRSACRRRAAAAATIALQAAIHALGNYGVFNALTAALCVPLLAPDARVDAGAGAAAAAAALQALGVLAFATNSY